MTKTQINEQVAWWRFRDLCPSCNASVEPSMMLSDGRKVYRHDCNGDVEWSAYSPADTAATYEPPRCAHGTEDVERCNEGGHDQ